MTTSDVRNEQRGDGNTPQVQVFDNRTPSGAVMTDEETARGYRTTSTVTPTVPAASSFNWGAAIIGILVVLAIVALVMWLL